MVELANIIFTLFVLAGIILVLLLESHMQMIELAGIIFILSIKRLIDVILTHLFEDGLA